MALWCAGWGFLPLIVKSGNHRFACSCCGNDQILPGVMNSALYFESVQNLLLIPIGLYIKLKSRFLLITASSFFFDCCMEAFTICRHIGYKFGIIPVRLKCAGRFIPQVRCFNLTDL